MSTIKNSFFQCYPGSGSGSISTRYGTGSFYQEKIVWKNLIPTVSWLIYDFLYLKNYLNVDSKSTVISKKKIFVAILKVTDENSRIQSRIRNSEVGIRGFRVRTKMSRIHNTGIYAYRIPRCWEEWNNACEIKFYTKILSYKKKYEFFLASLKVHKIEIFCLRFWNL